MSKIVRLFGNRILRIKALLTLFMALLLVVTTSLAVLAQGPFIWVPQSSGTGAHLRGVDFIDANNGWVAAYDGIIIHTTDGGNTWSLQYDGPQYFLNDIDFVDANNGWAVGTDGTILHTSDGGVTWDTQANVYRHALLSVDFVDANTGWVSGTQSGIWHTNDGGATWTYQSSGIPTSPNGDLYIDFADSNNGWVVNYGGRISHTTDGGATWVRQYNTGTTSWLKGVHSVDANNVWAVGKGGVVIHTTDGGTSWTPQNTGTTEILAGVHFVDINTGWASGNKGVIIHTSDGGATWTLEVSGTTNWLPAIMFPDSNHGWATGNFDTLLAYVPQPPVLYGVNSHDDGLSSIDPDTGDVSFIGQLDPSDCIYTTPISMAIRPTDGEIFVWNNSDGTGDPGPCPPIIRTGVLLTVDRNTGLATQISSTNQGQLSALAFDPDGILYGLDTTLNEIDDNTGIIAYVGDIGLRIGAADFDTGGTLYGVELTNLPERLVTIDTNTGIATTVATITTDIGTIGSIVFAPDGTLIGSGFNGPQGSILFDIDKTTGEVSNIRSLSGGFAPQGMGFYPPTTNQPPDATTAYADTGCLWPPNHKLVDINILGVTDPDDDTVNIVITGITSDEPTASDKGSGGAKHAPDADGVGTDTASVRAERSGDGNGRVYEITFTADDGNGGVSTGSVTVSVPHDQSSKDSCSAVDSGQNFDATAMN
ncbi:WD40/YVTN/BNR-like repeat-containing protein [Chloroflexota bacterium]